MNCLEIPVLNRVHQMMVQDVETRIHWNWSGAVRGNQKRGPNLSMLNGRS